MWNNPTSPNSCPEDATPVDRIVQPCACAFDVTIKLIDHRDRKRLTPLRVPDYEELASGTSKNQDYVDFEIEVKENQVDKLEIIIAVENAPGRRRIFFDDLKRERAVGIHHWRWDGYSTAGVLDTKVLKDPDLRLELRAELCGETKTEILAFDNQTDAEDWGDVIINRNNKTVAVELRTNIKDGGENGVGDAPPKRNLGEPERQDDSTRGCPAPTPCPGAKFRRLDEPCLVGAGRILEPQCE